MTKNSPDAPDATLALQTVAEASQTSSTQEGTIFDDLSLLGALLFGEPITEALIDEVAPDRWHKAQKSRRGENPAAALR